MRLAYYTQPFLLLLLVSCVTVEEPPKKEPAIIAVRNLSYDDLSVVQLSGITAQHAATGRFGSVSPVPSGITQSVVRSRNAPALPPEMMVRWTDKIGKQYYQKVSIQELLSKATGNENEAIVFVIQTDQKVHVVLEYRN